ncbi:MAG: protein kinase [Planctomycetota bacterium]|nr:protein kinase [Planctomycetota bacterium]
MSDTPSRPSPQSGPPASSQANAPAVGPPGASGTRKAIRIEGYKIIEKVGQGAMGAVYKARQIHMDRIVALKLLPPRLAKDPKFIEHFYAEARASARLNHQHVVAGIDVGESHGIHYFAMEFVEGETALEKLRRDGPFKPEAALKIATQIAMALDHAHKNHLVHRDIKPDNILLDAGGTAKLADLGLAKCSAEGDEDNLNTGKKAIGTPAYMSPEQARGQDDIEIRADLYGLGATLYQMLTRNYLFTGRSREVMKKQVKRMALSVLTYKPQLDPGFAFIIEKCLCKDREHRYADPAALLEDLERLAQGEVPEAAFEDLGPSSMAPTAEHLRDLGVKYPPPEARAARLRRRLPRKPEASATKIIPPALSSSGDPKGSGLKKIKPPQIEGSKGSSSSIKVAERKSGSDSSSRIRVAPAMGAKPSESRVRVAGKRASSSSSRVQPAAEPEAPKPEAATPELEFDDARTHGKPGQTRAPEIAGKREGGSAASSSRTRPSLGDRTGFPSRLRPVRKSSGGMLTFVIVLAVGVIGVAVFWPSGRSGDGARQKPEVEDGSKEQDKARARQEAEREAELKRVSDRLAGLTEASAATDVLNARKELKDLLEQTRYAPVKEAASAGMKQLDERLAKGDAAELGARLETAKPFREAANFKAALAALQPEGRAFATEEASAKLDGALREVRQEAEEWWARARKANREAGAKPEAIRARLKQAVAGLPEDLAKEAQAELDEFEKGAARQAEQERDAAFVRRRDEALQARATPAGWLDAEARLQALAAEEAYAARAAELQAPLSEIAPAAALVKAAREAFPKLAADRPVNWWLDGEKPLAGKVETPGAERLHALLDSKPREVRLEDLAPEDLLGLADGENRPGAERLALHAGAARMLAHAERYARAQALLDRAQKLEGAAADADLQALAALVAPKIAGARGAAFAEELAKLRAMLDEGRVGAAKLAWVGVQRDYAGLAQLAEAKDEFEKVIEEASRKRGLEDRLKGALGELDRARQLALAAAKEWNLVLQKQQDFFEVGRLLAATQDYEQAERALGFLSVSGPQAAPAVLDGRYALLKAHLLRLKGDAKGSEEFLKTAGQALDGAPKAPPPAAPPPAGRRRPNPEPAPTGPFGPTSDYEATRAEIEKASAWLAEMDAARARSEALFAKQKDPQAFLGAEEAWELIGLLAGPLQRPMDEWAQLRVFIKAYPDHAANKNGDALWRSSELAARFALWVDAVQGLQQLREQHGEHAAVARGDAHWIEAVARTIKQDYAGAQALYEAMATRFPEHWSVVSGEAEKRIALCKKRR